MVNSCAVCGCCTRTDIVREHLEDTLRICDVSAKGLLIISWLKSNSFYENYRKKTPEALECTHILGTTAEQVVVRWSNARPGGINFRQMPAYTEVIVSQMPGGCPGGDDRGWI